MELRTETEAPHSNPRYKENSIGKIQISEREIKTEKRNEF